MLLFVSTKIGSLFSSATPHGGFATQGVAQLKLAKCRDLGNFLWIDIGRKLVVVGCGVRVSYFKDTHLHRGTMEEEHKQINFCILHTSATTNNPPPLCSHLGRRNYYYQVIIVNQGP